MGVARMNVVKLKKRIMVINVKHRTKTKSKVNAPINMQNAENSYEKYDTTKVVSTSRAASDYNCTLLK